MTHASTNPVGDLLRAWRAARGKSQLALATDAGVSSRHVSFLETGRAAPSREMVLLLSDALEVPLRERNELLQAAGFAPMFRETPLDAPELGPVRQALDALLRAYGAYPAVVVNRRCDVLMSNEAALKLRAFFLPPASLAGTNLVRLMIAPDGARPFIENWREVASELAFRVRRESLGHDTDLLRDLAAAELAPAARSPTLTSTAPRQPAALLPIRLCRDGVRLELFSTTTTLGTPLDVTLQELRIEGMFPADAASERHLAAIVAAPFGTHPALAPAADEAHLRPR